MKVYKDAGINVSGKFTTILLDLGRPLKYSDIKDRQMGIKTVVKTILISDLLRLS